MSPTISTFQQRPNNPIFLQGSIVGLTLWLTGLRNRVPINRDPPEADKSPTHGIGGQIQFATTGREDIFILIRCG